MSAAMELSGLIPISVARLVPTPENAGFDLYRRDRTSQKALLYRGSSLALRQPDIESLRERGFDKLYIPRTAQEPYQAYMRRLVGLDGPRLEASLTSRTSALNEVVRDVLGASFRSGDRGETVDAATRLGALAAEIICHADFDEEELFRVIYHDGASCTHSANVGFYAGILAKQMQFADGEVEEVITGGLLHDLGMLEIDSPIREKPGRLDQDEYRDIQRHPILGFQMLAHRTELSEGQLMMAYQHHERIDGQGYPVGLVGNEIHPWAKLCSVVDVFAALTSHRPHRQPKSKDLVRELLQRGSGKIFDPEILACWVNITQTFWRS